MPPGSTTPRLDSHVRRGFASNVCSNRSAIFFVVKRDAAVCGGFAVTETDIGRLENLQPRYPETVTANRKEPAHPASLDGPAPGGRRRNARVRRSRWNTCCGE